MLLLPYTENNFEMGRNGTSLSIFLDYLTSGGKIKYFLLVTFIAFILDNLYSEFSLILPSFL